MSALATVDGDSPPLGHIALASSRGDGRVGEST